MRLVCCGEMRLGCAVQVMRHMSPAYLRVMRLVCRGWAEFAGRHTSSLKPEALEGMRLSQRFPHLLSLDLSHCQHMVVHPKVPFTALLALIGWDKGVSSRSLSLPLLAFTSCLECTTQSSISSLRYLMALTGRSIAAYERRLYH